MYTYNTNIPDIKLKKYGRNLEKMVMHVASLKEKAQQQPYAEGLVAVMRNLASQKDGSSGSVTQLWADLMQISDHKLKIETPYPVAQQVKRNPTKKFVPKPNIKFQCCGQLVTQFIVAMCQKLSSVEDPKPYLLYLVKIVQSTHNNHSTKGILKHIEEVAQQKLPLPHEDIIKAMPEKPRSTSNNRPRRRRRFSKK